MLTFKKLKEEKKHMDNWTDGQVQALFMPQSKQNTILTGLIEISES